MEESVSLKCSKLGEKAPENLPNEKQPCTKFDDLPDDCVTYIFLFLPIFDRIRLESVCKRFCYLSRQSWYQFEKLDFSPETWGWPPDKPKCIYAENFKDVLKRCHKYLKTIDLNTTIRNEIDDEDGLYHSLHFGSIQDICQLCPNLRFLYLNEIQLHPSGNKVTSRMKKYKHISAYTDKCFWLSHKLINSMIPHCENWIHLSFNLQRHFYNNTKSFSDLITKMQKLKMLHLCSGSKLSGEILLGLSVDTIEEIYLEECDGYWSPTNADLLNAVLERCNNLQTFVLKGCIQERTVDLPRMKNLKNLGLSFKMRDSSQLRGVLQLFHLQKLNVEANYKVDDQFLKGISKNCRQLIHLNISRCYHLSDKGMSDFEKLTKLEYLIMSDTKLSSKFLCGASARLKLLDCSNCKRVGDTGLVTLINWALGLRVLILQMCPKVTNSLIWSINNNISLRDPASEKSPLMLISNDETMLDDWRLSNHAKVVKQIVRKSKYGTDLKNVHFPTDKDFVAIPYDSVIDEYS